MESGRKAKVTSRGAHGYPVGSIVTLVDVVVQDDEDIWYYFTNESGLSQILVEEEFSWD